MFVFSLFVVCCVLVVLLCLFLLWFVVCDVPFDVFSGVVRGVLFVVCCLLRLVCSLCYVYQCALFDG